MTDQHFDFGGGIGGGISASIGTGSGPGAGSGPGPDPAVRRARYVIAKASVIVWAAARLTDNPTETLARARAFATGLIARLMLRAGPGTHLVTCVTKRADGSTPLHASMPIASTADSAVVPSAAAEQAFGALLMLGVLTREPLGLLMRSCSDERHYAPGHTSVVRGWMVHDGTPLPMKRSVIRAVFAASPGSSPPPHPERGVRYETAFSLEGDDEGG